MDVCKVCHETELYSDSRKQYGICADCVDTLGLAPMPPPRRPPVPCTRCNAMRFVRAIPRVKVDEPRGAVPGVTTTGGSSVVSPAKLTYPLDTRPKLFGGGVEVRAPRFRAGVGTLEAYVCTACGYVEWYCWDPDEIEIGPEFMTDIVDYSPDARGTPYR